MITFPATPADGDTYTAGGRLWTYSATRTAWEANPIQGATGAAGAAGAAGASVTGPAGASYPQRSFQIFADLRGWYQTSAYLKILDMSQTPGLFASGIQITSWSVDCSSATPSTQLAARLFYCDALAGGVFPGTNPQAMATLNTTAGNSAATGLTVNIPANKILYLMLDSDPVDSGLLWSVIVNYTIL